VLKDFPQSHEWTPTGAVDEFGEPGYPSIILTATADDENSSSTLTTPVDQFYVALEFRSEEGTARKIDLAEFFASAFANSDWAGPREELAALEKLRGVIEKLIEDRKKEAARA
jgi:hypothetical protein